MSLLLSKRINYKKAHQLIILNHGYHGHKAQSSHNYLTSNNQLIILANLNPYLTPSPGLKSHSFESLRNESRNFLLSSSSCVYVCDKENNEKKISFDFECLSKQIKRSSTQDVEEEIKDLKLNSKSSSSSSSNYYLNHNYLIKQLERSNIINSSNYYSAFRLFNSSNYVNYLSSNCLSLITNCIYTFNFLSVSKRYSTMSQSPPASNGSLCRQNYHEECEALVNKQINMELYASYVYMSMAYYFDREDVALPGFHAYFKKASDEEREHAQKFMKYQNKRGGRIVLQNIVKPTMDEWTGAIEAVSAALELEKTVNQTLLDLHGVASSKGDPQLCDFLETEFLEEQVHGIKELSDHITNLKRVGKGLGEYMFDKELKEMEK